MIEFYFHNEEIKRIHDFNLEINSNSKLLALRLVDCTVGQLSALSVKYNLDFQAMNKREDIELSSHYIDLDKQLSLNISLPLYDSEDILEEETIHLIVKSEVFFIFMNADIDDKINLLTKYRYDFEQLEFNSYLEIFVFQLGVLSDYFADIAESISQQIKEHYYSIVISKQFTESKLDILTKISFNNFLLLESITEFQKIILLLRKKYANEKLVIKKLSLENEDLNIIIENIQFNFERVKELKQNVNSKIELEQNYLFKLLTIITVCISLPTLIVGLYGMNFEYMPELKMKFGYLGALILIFLSFVLPLLYFKRKKWF